MSRLRRDVTLARRNQAWGRLRVIAVAALAAALGCTSIVYTTAPPCPAWSEEAEAQLAQMMALAQAEGVELDALEEAIGRQELFCHVIEPEALPEEVCTGSRLGCWWREVWR